MGLYHGYGTVTKEYKTIKPKKSMCSGCRNNFYNGNNEYGVQECWSFKHAKVCDKEAYPSIYATSAERRKYKKTLTCYHSVNK